MVFTLTPHAQLLNSAGIVMQDPLADGPTIQSASTRSLAKGTTVSKVCITFVPVQSDSVSPHTCALSRCIDEMGMCLEHDVALSSC